MIVKSDIYVCLVLRSFKTDRMTRSKLENKLTEVFNRYIRLKNDHCFICGPYKKSATLVCGHFIKSRYKRYTWDEIN